MFYRPRLGVRLSAAVCPSLLLSLALSLAIPATRAADAPAPAPKGEASAAEPLRDRLADRLKEDAAALKLSTKPSQSPSDIKTSNPVDLRARRATVKPSAAAASAAKAGIPWSYTGEGAPDRWAQLQPEYRQCGVGTRQSPIDLRDTIKVDQEQIQFDYKPSSFSVVDSGHTIQVNVSAGNSIQIMGRRFELQQFHFHRPSEERINGRQYDMVAHLEHKDAEGRPAVIAVLLERGQDQSLIQTVWNYLPLERGDTYNAPVPIDLNQLLPKDRAYFSYMGSMTTPPCTEGVLWMVLRQPVPVSMQQISVFSHLYPMNARPLQSASGRLIKESN